MPYSTEAHPAPLTAEEIAAIDARFHAGETVWMWCLHHEVLFESLTEPLSARIAYIKAHKETDEIPIRLSEIQPVKNMNLFAPACKAYEEAIATARKALEDLHRDEYPGTCWNGKSIFAY